MEILLFKVKLIFRVLELLPWVRSTLGKGIMTVSATVHATVEFPCMIES
jgi:hypothetical protein